MTDHDGEEEQQDKAPVHSRLPADLTERERKIELRLQEGVIERFRRAGLEAGAALATIRAQRLYRGMIMTVDAQRVVIKTFRQYCRLRWGWEASRARQLIGAASAAGVLKELTGHAPVNENQVRPLVRMLGSEQSRDLAVNVWNMVTARGVVTDRAIREALEAMETRVPEVTDSEPAKVVASDVVARLNQADLAARLNQAYAAVTRLVEAMGMTDYHQGLSDEQRNTLKSVVRETISALRNVLAAL